jgi:hypothetical protein
MLKDPRYESAGPDTVGLAVHQGTLRQPLKRVEFLAVAPLVLVGTSSYVANLEPIERRGLTGVY